MKSKNIVLLHGWGASSRKLKPLSDELANLGWKTYVVKLPGFELNAPENVWDVDAYADYVLKKAKLKFKDSFYMFGHSFGGRIAIKLSTRNIDLVGGVILCATSGLSRANALKRYFFKLLATVGKVLLRLPLVSKLWRKIIYMVAREHDYEKAEGIMKEIFKKVINENLRPYISQIRKPTLILWGAEDKMTPVSDAHYINKNLNQSKLVLFNSEGHKLPYLSPKRVAEEINKWYRNL